MSDDAPLHYWDSCTFIHIIQGNEPDGGRILKTRVRDVTEGRLRIVTSMFTLAEVVKPKRSKSVLSTQDETKIRSVFLWPILLYELTRKIAERARELQWLINNIKPYDAIHLATAEFAYAYRFDTYDDPLIKAVNKAPPNIWNHKFGIGHPDLIGYELDV